MFLCRSCCHIPKPGRDVQLPLVDKQQAIPVNTNRRKCLLRKSTLKAARRSLSHFQLAGALTEVGRSRGRLPSNRSPKVLHPIQPRTRWIRGPSPRARDNQPARPLAEIEDDGRSGDCSTDANRYPPPKCALLAHEQGGNRCEDWDPRVPFPQFPKVVQRTVSGEA